LENAIAAAYLDPNNGHTYLYVGATRYDNSGSTTLGVWFSQDSIGKSGGKFYHAEPDGKGGTTLDLTKPAAHNQGDLLLVA
ncbi:hypothetical protein DEM28_29180, partial [Enterobacter mori]